MSAYIDIAAGDRLTFTSEGIDDLLLDTLFTLRETLVLQ